EDRALAPGGRDRHREDDHGERDQDRREDAPEPMSLRRLELLDLGLELVTLGRHAFELCPDVPSAVALWRCPFVVHVSSDAGRRRNATTAAPVGAATRPP